MTSEQLDKLLAKIPTDKVYDDLLHPGLSKVGQVLSDVFDLGNLILLPFKLVNEKSKIFLRRNLEQYANKLEKIDSNDLCNVPVQIGLPIIDKLTIMENDELSNVFINLLTKASTSKTQSLVHPAFLNILNNLSQDEAIMLMAMKNEERHPFIDVYVTKTESTLPIPETYGKPGAKTRVQLKDNLAYEQSIVNTPLRVAYNLTGIEKEMKLYFPENIDVYLENLEKSGIIEFERTQYDKGDEEKYNKLINEHYKNVIDDVNKEIERINSDDNLNFKSSLSLRKCSILFTEFGMSFIKAVIKEIDELKEA